MQFASCKIVRAPIASTWCSRVLINRVRVKSELLTPRVRVESKSSNFSTARVRVQVRVLDPRVRVKSESTNLSETRVQVESRVLKSYLLHKNHIYCILFGSNMFFNSHKISHRRKQEAQLLQGWPTFGAKSIFDTVKVIE